MKKKILGIVVAIVMLFAVVGLAACELNNPTLAQYQATARVDLTNYANSRGQTNFTIENWEVIQGHVTTGKAAIDAAETKPAVRTARDNAKAAIGAVRREDASMNEIEFTEGVFNGFFDGANFDGVDRIAAIIRSTEELVSFFEGHEVTWSNAPIWENYSESFFENNVLMLFFFQTSGVLGSQISFAVDSIQVVNGTLTLYIQANTYSEMISDVVVVVPFVVEVSNSDIKSIANFSVNFITGQQP